MTLFGRALGAILVACLILTAAADGVRAAGSEADVTSLRRSAKVYFDADAGAFTAYEFFVEPMSYRYVDVCHCVDFEYCEVLDDIYMYDPDGDGYVDDGLCEWVDEIVGEPPYTLIIKVCTNVACY